MRCTPREHLGRAGLLRRRAQQGHRVEQATVLAGDVDRDDAVADGAARSCGQRGEQDLVGGHAEPLRGSVEFGGQFFAYQGVDTRTMPAGRVASGAS